MNVYNTQSLNKPTKLLEKIAEKHLKEIKDNVYFAERGYIIYFKHIFIKIY